MMNEIKLWQRAMSAIMIAVMMFCLPSEAIARTSLLQNGTDVILSVSENFKADSHDDSGIINATVVSDVYSADGSTVLINAGTPATIEYSAQSNGCWGKAGKICLNKATTRTVDNSQVSLNLGNCRTGGSRLGGVIVLSVLFFPIGLISGCMKGSMPEISQGSTFSASVARDVTVE